MNDNLKGLPPDKQKFLKVVLAAAQSNRHKTGIPASITVAQCLLESAWGVSRLSIKDQNYFGIKAGGGWTGPIAVYPTSEFVSGKWITVEAEFRKYGSLQESIDDHGKFLLSSPIYRPAFDFKNDYKGFAHVLQGTYATDPTYAQQLIQIIECYGLQFYDFKV
jgi:flagellum-specific peptidoglycan hydrolase FlgJ